LPCAAGELHPRPRDSQCHPLILDGLSDSASRLRARLRRDCACTFYLVFKEPAARSRRSPSALFPSGEPSYLKDGFRVCQLLFASSSIFFRIGSRRVSRPSRSDATSSPMFRALRCDLGVASLKEVFRVRAVALLRNGPFDAALSRFVGTAGHARSTQYTPRVGGCQPPPRPVIASSATTRDGVKTNIDTTARHVNPIRATPRR